MNPTLPLYLTEQIGLTGSSVGIIVAVYAFSALLTRPLMGYLLDTYSRTLIYTVCLLLFGCTFVTYAVAESFSSLLAIRCMQGFLWGGITAAGSTLAADTVPSVRRGEGLSQYGISMPIAMGLGPIFGVFIYNHWGFTYVWVGAMSLTGLAVLSSLLINPAQDKPHLSHAATAELEPKSQFSLYFKPGLRIALVMLLVAFPQGNAISFSALYGKDIGMENPGIIYVMIAVGSIVSRFIVGKNLDKGNITLIISAALITLSSAYLCLALIPSSTCFITAGLFIGIGFGMFMPTLVTLNMNLAHVGQRGTASATLFTAMDLGFGLGVISGGNIYEMTGTLSNAYLISATVDIIACAMAVFIMIPHYKRSISIS